MYYGGWPGGGHPHAIDAELQHPAYGGLAGRGGGVQGAFGGGSEYGYGGGLPRDAGYMHMGPMQPLVPQHISGGVRVDGQVLHKHAYDLYEEERGRDLEERGRHRSPRRRRSSSRSRSGGRGGRRRARSGDDESDAEESGDEEIVARVEGVEEELRALADDKREQDAQVQEQISQALTLAQKIGSGAAVCRGRLPLCRLSRLPCSPPRPFVIVPAAPGLSKCVLAGPGRPSGVRRPPNAERPLLSLHPC